jgi:integrase/recombinase XerD
LFQHYPMNKKAQVTVEAFLWKYYTTKQGLHPIRIKVTHNRKTTFYPVQIDGKNVYVGKEQWASINSTQPRKENKKIKEAIEDHKSKARESIQSITFQNQTFSKDRFENQFLPGSTKKGFFDFFSDYLLDLENEDRSGSYSAYNCALQALRKFRNNRDIDPIDITPSLLKDFEKFLKSERLELTSTGKQVVRKASVTTVGIYMRTIRAVYNYTTDKLPYLREHYPFSRTANERNKYHIQAGSGSKGSALSIDELNAFSKIETIDTSADRRAKQLWLFSFFCQGMNFNDMAHLRYSNIKGDKIEYVRQKTSRTERKQELLEIPLSEEISGIISELGIQKKSNKTYVFDILSENVQKKDERKVINQKLKTVNNRLKLISRTNGLPPITTYWARHTYASLVKESGESVEMIRELLGHSDIKTTESYLKRFDLNRKKKVNEKIQMLLK